jgi:hypothetical protein
MDATLTTLLRDLIGKIDTHTVDFREGRVDADGWQRRMAKDLIETHTAAYLAGTGGGVIRAADKRVLTQVLGDQIDYLNRFADDLQAGEDEAWTTRNEARARLYAGAIKHSFWRGTTKGLDLPAYPGDGTSDCLVNCNCAWEIDGDDAYWRLGPTDHCETCRERATTWNPYQLQREESDE